MGFPIDNAKFYGLTQDDPKTVKTFKFKSAKGYTWPENRNDLEGKWNAQTGPVFEVVWDNDDHKPLDYFVEARQIDGTDYWMVNDTVAGWSEMPAYQIRLYTLRLLLS